MTRPRCPRNPEVVWRKGGVRPQPPPGSWAWLCAAGGRRRGGAAIAIAIAVKIPLFCCSCRQTYSTSW
jgi:hypothetical protein